ncbi:MAG: hemin uptake protein HemP [Gammaproteobacteria bacterium]|nr:hemin uptake protein HemP [Gammaproteobacteria bacterium]MCP5196000.1 hemin uptake protein HemP [Gammaproteobacteria bacterium]
MFIVNPPSHAAPPAQLDRCIGITRKRLVSSDLFGDAQEILIEHAGQEYRLRITRQGKLILTK